MYDKLVYRVIERGGREYAVFTHTRFKLRQWMSASIRAADSETVYNTISRSFIALYNSSSNCKCRGATSQVKDITININRPQIGRPKGAV